MARTRRKAVYLIQVPVGDNAPHWEDLEYEGEDTADALKQIREGNFTGRARVVRVTADVEVENATIIRKILKNYIAIEPVT